ncbi:unnamed protein product [Notodromas monacha]|uniref:Uncharacterized protein n=1 Tax=Notodromas monacha TaxID=399045 RepID=A0A7R9GGB7_9CRUS|nr:unnamed protein product [Notodromas monacha]CAG0919796.1 unnamed protein product [Notodromas monacha]
MTASNVVMWAAEKNLLKRLCPSWLVYSDEVFYRLQNSSKGQTPVGAASVFLGQTFARPVPEAHGSASSVHVELEVRPER